MGLKVQLTQNHGDQLDARDSLSNEHVLINHTYVVHDLAQTEVVGDLMNLKLLWCVLRFEDENCRPAASSSDRWCQEWASPDPLLGLLLPSYSYCLSRLCSSRKTPEAFPWTFSNDAEWNKRSINVLGSFLQFKMNLTLISVLKIVWIERSGDVKYANLNLRKFSAMLMATSHAAEFVNKNAADAALT